MNGAAQQQSGFLPSLIRAGFDWSGVTGRLAYILVTIAVVVLASFIPVTRNFSGGNTAVFVALTMLFPIWLGHTRRRLRDVGWSGWLMWVAILPVVGLILTIFLAFKPGGNLDAPADGGYSRLGFAVSLVFGCLLLSRAFWAPYWVPGASMKPSLLIGDFVAVVPLSTPRRGDVLVFQPEGSKAEYIKRLIGLPGDTIALREGEVILNGTPLERSAPRDHTEPMAPQGPSRAMPRCANDPAEGGTCLKSELTETLPGGRGYQVLDVSPHVTDTMAEIPIPEGRYFVIGDNRDNSADSRLPLGAGGLGLIPQDNLTGRVARVIFSSEGASLLHVWTWRPERLFMRVR